MAEPHTPIVAVITGPSGAGKSCIIKEFLEVFRNHFVQMVTYTTRAPRKNDGVLEIDGIHYNFLTVQKIRITDCPHFFSRTQQIKEEGRRFRLLRDKRPRPREAYQRRPERPHLRRYRGLEIDQGHG